MSRETGPFGQEITRRELLRKAGVGLGAMAVGRYLGGSAAVAAEGPAGVLQLARVRPRTAVQAAALLHFDDTHRRFADGSIELLLWPGDAARLDRLGLPYRITVPDLVARDAAEAASATALSASPPGRPDATDYRRLADFEAELQALPAQYPGLARTFEMPEQSLEGRTIYGVEIGANVDAIDGRPVFYIDGIHHAREWPAAEYPMTFAHFLLQGYGADPRVTQLLTRARVTIVPIVNVDGFHHSRESTLQNSNLGIVAGGQGGYWRKNRRSYVDEQAAGNPLSFGVDPNRNYPLLWGATTGGGAGVHQAVSPVPVYASTSPNMYDQTYYGTAPLSEPETRNVAGYIRTRNVIGVITNHTVGPLVLRPWGHTAEETPDEHIMAPLGDRMAEILFDDPSRSMIGLGLYPTTGTTDDWAYAAVSALGYTLEHRGPGFHPTYASPQGPGHDNNWTRVMEAFMEAGETITSDENHSVIRGRVLGASGSPEVAGLTIHREFTTPMWQEGVDGIGPATNLGDDVTQEVLHLETATGPDGVIEWHLNPSTRPLLQADGQTESYTLTVTTGAGSRDIELVLRRGETLNLGDVTV